MVLSPYKPPFKVGSGEVALNRPAKPLTLNRLRKEEPESTKVQGQAAQQTAANLGGLQRE